MKRYILTGTPGSGKTSIGCYLEMNGYVVIREAVSDVITLGRAQGIEEPWRNLSFIDQIVTLQKQRQLQASYISSEVQFFDRSPLCTYALSTYFGYEPSVSLLKEIDRIESAGVYQRQVFFIQNLGFCQPSEVRKISFEDSLRFEKIHEETYNLFGYECIKIGPQMVFERVEKIINML